MALSSTFGTDMRVLAKKLQASGRGKDSMLAHITPQEAAILKARGGRGSQNPVTGLLEFDDTPIPEQINVTAPPAQPAVDVSGLNVQPQQQAQPVEQVTSTANAAPTSVTVPDLSFAAPTNPSAAYTAPAAAPAPEQVTSTATQAPSFTPPVITGQYGFGAPFIPPASPAPEQTTDQGTQDFLTRNKTLLELGGLGALGLYGGVNAGNAGKQAQALQTNLSNLAAPLSAQGNAALSTTMAGGLTPGSSQALEAVKAQIAQGQSQGAVSSQQAAEAISSTYATLLNNQLTQALNLLNTADQYLQTAYLQGYQANVANQQNTQTFYSNLAQLAARMAGVGGGTTINLGTGTA